MSANLSPCGLYRWTLGRDVPRSRVFQRRKSGFVLWVMLNPSVADASLDDPTIRRCKSFTRAWGYEHMEVVNLYGLRATDPQELWKAADPVGAMNDAWIHPRSVAASLVVCGWGAQGNDLRAEAVIDLLLVDNPTIYCLGTTKTGAPKHPLYLAGNTPLQVFRKS